MTPALLVAAAGAITIIGQIVAGKPPAPRIFIAVPIAGAGMLALAQWSPELAYRLAAVVFLTALLTSGYDVAKGVNNSLGLKTPPKGSS